jgi:hypothetical protein
MSVRTELVRLVGDDYLVKEEKDAEEHGEPGRRVTLNDGSDTFEFFFADDRKINDEHAAVIINSYLRNSFRLAADGTS